MCGFFISMKEKIIKRGEEKVIEVRSDGGKLLFIKTKKGYEMKCPRTKEICLLTYEEIIKDCLQCLEGQEPTESLVHYLQQINKK